MHRYVPDGIPIHSKVDVSGIFLFPVLEGCMPNKRTPASAAVVTNNSNSGINFLKLDMQMTYTYLTPIKEWCYTKRLEKE
jgi:hypothetical protein